MNLRYKLAINGSRLQFKLVLLAVNPRLLGIKIPAFLTLGCTRNKLILCSSRCFSRISGRGQMIESGLESCFSKGVWLKLNSSSIVSFASETRSGHSFLDIDFAGISHNIKLNTCTGFMLIYGSLAAQTLSGASSSHIILGSRFWANECNVLSRLAVVHW